MMVNTSSPGPVLNALPSPSHFIHTHLKWVLWSHSSQMSKLKPPAWDSMSVRASICCWTQTVQFQSSRSSLPSCSSRSLCYWYSNSHSYQNVSASSKLINVHPQLTVRPYSSRRQVGLDKWNVVVQLGSVSSDSLPWGERSMWLSTCSTCHRTLLWLTGPRWGWRQQLWEAACQSPSQDLPANTSGSIEMAEQEPSSAIRHIKPWPSSPKFKRIRSPHKQNSNAVWKSAPQTMLGPQTMQPDSRVDVWEESKGGRPKQQIIPNTFLFSFRKKI